MRGRGVDDPHARTLGHRHRLPRGIVVQAQHRKVRRMQGIAPGGILLALGIVEDDQLELGPRRQPGGDFQTGGAGGAVDENLQCHAASAVSSPAAIGARAAAGT